MEGVEYLDDNHNAPKHHQDDPGLELDNSDDEQAYDHNEQAYHYEQAEQDDPMEGIEPETPSNPLPSRRKAGFINHVKACFMHPPDRFVPNRNPWAEPREAFLLSTPPQQLSGSERYERRQNWAIDPFGRRGAARRQEPVSSELPTTSRSNGLFSATRINPADNMRGASHGAVWNVGGSATTDGVQSVSDGRGGNITSGTNAPMFRSAFFDNQRNDVDDDLNMYGRRLATAIDVDQASRVLAQDAVQPGTCPSGPCMHPSRSCTHSCGSRSPLSELCKHPSQPDTSPIQLCTHQSKLAQPPIWQDCEWKKPGLPLYRQGRVRLKKTIPVIPFRVLDAPALRDDYYCSLLAYSYTAKCLAVGLGSQVYTWSETRGVKTPESLTHPFSGHVTSLSFSSTEGGKSILAIGRADGRVTLWSPPDPDPRFNSDQPSPVSCVCFGPRTFRRVSDRDQLTKVQVEYLLVGDEAGHVYLYAIEWPSELEADLFAWHGSMTLLARMTLHTQQICGLAWSPEGNYFASGGNDNSLFLFERRRVLRPENATPERLVPVREDAILGTILAIKLGQESHHFTLNAAVKALAFCPWQPSLLAAGGGSNDRCIHFYHTLSGATLATIDCAAQVTSLVWSRTRREIAATFGFAQPDHPIRVAVFSWPGCETVVRIP